jgi:hypothetical protein
MVNFAHLHLLMNHWPIIGTFIAFGLYLVSFLGSNSDLRRSSLIIYAFIALVTIPAFLSGVGAQAWIKHEPGISMALMNRHEGAALLTLTLMLVTGSLALAGLWQTHEDSRVANWNLAAIMIFSILTLIMVIRTGNTGGDIRHAEIRDNPTAPVTEGTFGSIVHVFEPNPDKVTAAMAYSKWCTAVLMDLHFIGLALLIATVGILDLRILGFAKAIPLSALHRFVPWALLGLGINVATGLMTYMGSPALYNFDEPFWLKMGMLMLLGINTGIFYLTGIFSDVEHLGAGEDAPMSAKLIAVSSLILWAAVIVFGRYIQVGQDSLPFGPG